ERTRHVPPDYPWQLLDRAAARRVGRFLAGKRPRAVVATHPGPARLAGALRAAGQLDAPVFAVVTDYVVHGLWARPRVDWYLVGHVAARCGLTAPEIDPARVGGPGIAPHACDG